MTHKIAVIGGDYIGPDVVAEGIKVMRAAGVDFTTTDFDLGAQRYQRDGEVLSDDTLEALRSFDAVFMGAIGGKPGEVPGGLLERGIILRTRFDFDQYINLRPFVLPERDIDFVVVRENTEGTYAGEGGFLRKDTQHEVATQGSVNTRMGVERCIRYAFELADRRDRKQLTLVHKTNVLAYAGDLWWRVFNLVAAEYPDVETNYQHIDAACIHFVDNPQQYSVIVTDNLFGDILTDLGGAVSGGIGTAASANLNPDGTAPSMFEPVHGSAPDIAGQNKANPVAAILSTAMMVEFLGEADAGKRIRAACEDAPDGSTTEIGDAVAARLA